MSISAPAAAAAGAPRVAVLYSNPSYAIFGVDDRGVSYGVSSDRAQQNTLYASRDQARTWDPAYYFPQGSRIVLVRPVGGSTLLAGVLHGTYGLWRSGDNGRTWAEVYTFAKLYGLLTPHSIATDGHGRIYMGAYNYFANPGNHPTPILRSKDDGRTWTVVFTERTSRHAHCTSYDPYTGDVYVCFGDASMQNQILRSTDRGDTWKVFIRGPEDRAVDIAFDRTYVYFGQDNQDHDAIVRANKKTGLTELLSGTRGASYSALRLRDGTFLIGQTYEPRGSIYVGQRTVHLYASRGGSSWVDMMQRPIRRDAAGYAYINTYYQYPNGSVPLLIAGYGTVVVRIGPPFPVEKPAPSERVAAAGAGGVRAPASAASGHTPTALTEGIAALLIGAASVLLATAAWVRRIGVARGPVEIRGVVIAPLQLMAGAISLVVVAILTFVLA